MPLLRRFGIRTLYPVSGFNDADRLSSVPCHRRLLPHWTRYWGLVVLACFVTSFAQVGFSQEPPTPSREVNPGEQIFQINARTSKLVMRHLDTRVLELDKRIRVVDGFDAEKLSVSPLSPHRVRLRGEGTGITNVKLIDEFDNVYVIEVFVEPDTRELEAYLGRLFPGSAIEVVGMRDAVVLRGWVTEPTQIPQIIEIAEEFYPTVHPQLQVGGVSQVQLNVKVMEVQRSKMRELGFNFLSIGQQYFVSNAVGGLAPIAAATTPFGGPPTATILPSALQNPEMQFAVTGSSNVFHGFLKALQTENLAKILAEPVLVTTSGRPASMLSGGEFPFLVPQSLGSVSIQWREFGVRLEAVPIVLGNGRLRLDVAPEVSERDYSNAVSVNGLVVPGITVRKVNTQVEMRFGETLMIGGLISTRKTGSMHKVPFLGELPWIGAAFSRKNYTVGETELVVLVTPQMVAPMMPQQVPPGGAGFGTDTPVDRELYFDGMLEVPKYGPDCPDCEQNTGLIVPDGMMMPERALIPEEIPGTPPEVNEPPDLSPIPRDAALKSSSNSNTVIQTSGTRPQSATRQRETTTTSPFKRHPRRQLNDAASNSASQPAVGGGEKSIPRDSTLPGLIQPNSAKQSGK